MGNPIVEIKRSCHRLISKIGFPILVSHRAIVIPDSKVHGANMGPKRVLSAPGGAHVGPMNLAIRDGDMAVRLYVPLLANLCGRLLLAPETYDDRKMYCCASNKWQHFERSQWRNDLRWDDGTAFCLRFFCSTPDACGFLLIGPVAQKTTTRWFSRTLWYHSIIGIFLDNFGVVTSPKHVLKTSHNLHLHLLSETEFHLMPRGRRA